MQQLPLYEISLVRYALVRTVLVLAKSTGTFTVNRRNDCNINSFHPSMSWPWYVSWLMPAAAPVMLLSVTEREKHFRLITLVRILTKS